ncbi:MAG: ATP-binding protein [Myxococcota bacterium]
MEGSRPPIGPTDHRDLIRWARKLHRAESFDHLLRLTQKNVVQRFGYADVCLYERRDQPDPQLVLLAVRGPASRIVAESAPAVDAADSPLVRRLLTMQAPLVVDRATVDEEPSLGLMAALQAETVAFFPIDVGDGAFMVFGVCMRGARWGIDRDEMVFLEALSQHLGTASARIRYLEQRREINEQTQALKDQILDAQKLESLGVLAAGLAHDVNNLLMAVLGNAAMAKRRLSASSPALRYLGEVENATQEAAALARRLLRQSEGPAREVNIAELAHETCRLLEVSLPPRVSAEMAEVSEALVEGDPSQLRRVILNLVINAAQAMGPDGGVIQVRTGAASMDRAALDRYHRGDELSPGRYAFIEVRDTGCGMDVETLAHLFEPRFTRRTGGHGLGLASVLAIVAEHRGAIRVRSAENEGSSFWVLLPAKQEDVRSRRRSGLGRSKDMVLVIDGQQSVRTFALRTIEGLGLRGVASATAGPILGELAGYRNRVRAVVLGLEVDEELDSYTKLRRALPEVPFLVASYDRPLLQDEDTDIWLQKPFRPETLIKRLAEILERSDEATG